MKFFIKMRYILIGLVCLAFVTSVSAYPDLLYNPMGVRAVGMGGSSVANPEGSESIFYNWATPATFESLSFKLEQGQKLGVPFYSFGIEKPFQISPLKLGFVASSISGFQETQVNSDGLPEINGRTFGSSLYSFFGSWQGSFYDFNLGILGQSTFESLATQNASAFSIGLAAQKNFEWQNTPIAIGLNIKNALTTPYKWSTGHSDTLSPIYTFGVSTVLLDKKLQLNTDFQFENGFPLRYFWGAEYWLTGNKNIANSFAARAGLRNGDFTLGLGMLMNGALFDYAYVLPQQSFAEVEHRFSFGWNFYTFQPNPIEEKALFKTSLTPKASLLVSANTQAITQVTLKPSESGFHIDFPARPGLIQFTADSFEDIVKIRVNATLIEAPTGSATAKTISETYPVKVFVYLKKTQDVSAMDIETAPNGQLAISGYLPKGYDLHINTKGVPIDDKGFFIYSLSLTADKKVFFNISPTK